MNERRPLKSTRHRATTEPKRYKKKWERSFEKIESDAAQEERTLLQKFFTAIQEANGNNKKIRQASAEFAEKWHEIERTARKNREGLAQAGFGREGFLKRCRQANLPREQALYAEIALLQRALQKVELRTIKSIAEERINRDYSQQK